MLLSGSGAAAVHCASSVGTICASHGLLLMIPDLYKITGELCPAVLHATARSFVTYGLSIYNDRCDIYAARMSDITMLYSNDVQEAHDLAASETLYTDVASSNIGKRDVEMIGGRYGISSKDFAPPHIEAIIKNLGKQHPADHFTIGVASPETELPICKPFDFLPAGTKQCIFWGLGSNGTVDANK